MLYIRVAGREKLVISGPPKLYRREMRLMLAVLGDRILAVRLFNTLQERNEMSQLHLINRKRTDVLNSYQRKGSTTNTPIPVHNIDLPKL